MASETLTTTAGGPPSFNDPAHQQPRGTQHLASKGSLAGWLVFFPLGAIHLVVEPYEKQPRPERREATTDHSNEQPRSELPSTQPGLDGDYHESGNRPYPEVQLARVVATPCLHTFVPTCGHENHGHSASYEPPDEVHEPPSALGRRRTYGTAERLRVPHCPRVQDAVVKTTCIRCVAFGSSRNLASTATGTAHGRLVSERAPTTTSRCAAQATNRPGGSCDAQSPAPPSTIGWCGNYTATPTSNGIEGNVGLDVAQIDDLLKGE